MKNNIVIDLFSGAGGMSLGAKMAGIETNYSIEYDKFASKTYKLNHPNTKVIATDIRDVCLKNELSSSPFIIFGGPPCQGFSSSNTKTRTLENDNNWMYKEYLRFVRDLKPIWFVFENVKGFNSFQKGLFSKMVENEFKEIGYTLNSKVLCSSEFGVPQERKRYFMIGNKNGIIFDFDSLHKSKKVTVKEAISDLPDLENGTNEEIMSYKLEPKSQYAKLMRRNSKSANQNFVSRNKDYIIERYTHIEQGSNWSSIPKKLLLNYNNTKNIHSGIYRRLDENKPSVVIANYRKSMLIHPKQNRGLSVREAARLQSFPDDYIFEGSLDSKQQQVGNAVPPLLAKVIFDEIVRLGKK